MAGKSEVRKKADWLVVAVVVLAVVLAPLVLYVGGYFALASKYDLGGVSYRVYEWMAHMYQPATQVESYFSGDDIRAVVIP